MNLRGLIIAGGRGSRLASARLGEPKPLVRIGGMSLVERALERCRAAGAREVWFALGFAADLVRRHAESSRRPHEIFRFEVEDSPLGTIGALGRLPRDAATVLVTNCDLVTDVDTRRVLEEHSGSNADLTLVVHRQTQRLDFGEVVHDGDGRVIDYVEKPTKSWLLSSGSNVVGPRGREVIRDGERLDVPDFVRRCVREGLAVRSCLHEGYWADVNDAETLGRAAAIEAGRETKEGASS